MTKKNFGDKLSKTVAASDTAMEERMSKLDKIFATTPGTATPLADISAAALPTAQGETEQQQSSPGFELVASPRPEASKPQASSSKVIRDNFSMPANDYALIDELRKVAAVVGERTDTTKSSVLRAGLRALKRMDPQEFVQLLTEVERVRPGRKGENL